MNYFNLKEEMIFDDLQIFLEAKNLSHLYIDTDQDDELIKKSDFYVLYLSYFSHFLTEEEYESEPFVSYSSAYKEPNYINELETIFNNFFTIFSFLYDKNNGDVYMECNSPVQIIKEKKVFMRHILNGLKERPIGVFVFPNISTTLSIGYDLTHKIYIKNTDNFKNEIIQLIINSKINIINPT